VIGLNHKLLIYSDQSKEKRSEKPLTWEWPLSIHN